MENDGHKDFGQHQKDNSCRVVLSDPNKKKQFIGHNRAEVTTLNEAYRCIVTCSVVK